MGYVPPSATSPKASIVAYTSTTGSGPRPLSVGNMTFLSEECPSRIALGALIHRLVVTELFGGGRTSANVGAQPKTVSWRGTFYQDVDFKIATLSGYLTTAQKVVATYGTQAWYVKVVEFTPDYAYLDTEYDITIEPIAPANGTLGSARPLSVSTQNANLLANTTAQVAALAASDPSVNDSLGPAVQSLSSSFASTPLETSSASDIAALTAQTQDVLEQAQSYAQTVPDLDPRSLPSSNAVDNLTLLSANVTSAERASTVSVNGGTMFDVAAQYCGSSSATFQLMTANGIYSPILSKSSSTLIYIPQALRSGISV